MSSSFNLLDKAWMRVTLKDGSTQELSLLEVFRQAEKIRAITGEMASQDAALLRLLLAICHRALNGPFDLSEWKRAWGSPQVLIDAACEYLEHHRHRFDVRDPQVPFFQVAGIRTKSGGTSGLEKLIADVPNGQPFFTTRRGRGVETLTWAEASRWLVHVHAYDPSGIRSGAEGDPSVKGGKGYPIGPGWTGQIGLVYVEGENLAQTLLLNTVVCYEVNELRDVDTDADLPPWERDPDGPAGAATLEPTGPVSCYTWQTRRVLLHGGDERVHGLFLGNGDRATPQNRFSVEPMTAWRYSEPQTKKRKGEDTYMPRKHSKEQAFWRGLPSLVAQLSPPVGGKDGIPRFRIPAVLHFYQRLMARGIVPATGLIKVHATGLEYGSNEAVIDEMIDDTLELPAKLVPPDSPLVAYVHDAMKEADLAAFAVRNLSANLHRAAGAEPGAAADIAEDTRAAVYAVLDAEFPRWLATLADYDPEAARKAWRRFLYSEAARQSKSLIAGLPPTAFSGRGNGEKHMDVGKALAFFNAAMRSGIPYPDSTDTAKTERDRTTA